MTSNSRLNAAGKALAESRASDDDHAVLDEHLQHCDDVQGGLVDALRVLLPGFVTEDGSHLAVLGRTKSLETLTEKMLRMPHLQLSRIRDVAGVRVTGSMLLGEQDAFVAWARAALNRPEGWRVIDRRAAPSHGYRALHAEFKVEGVWVELQVRTALQAAWAELFERLADQWGRGIRYGEAVEDPHAIEVALQLGAGATRMTRSSMVDVMQQLSVAISVTEDAYQRTQEARLVTERSEATIRGTLDLVARHARAHGDPLSDETGRS